MSKTVTLKNAPHIRSQIKELRAEINDLYHHRMRTLEHEHAELNAAVWELEELAAGASSGKRLAQSSRIHNAIMKGQDKCRADDQALYIEGFIAGLTARIQENLTIVDA